MIFRTFDPSLHNEIAAIPSVRATFGIHIDPSRPIVFDELADAPGQYILLTNGVDACAIFENFGPSVFMGHSLYGLSCRGRKAIIVGRAMLDWMWRNTGAQIITGATPVENTGARWFNRQVGFISDGMQPFHGSKGDYSAEWFRAHRPAA